MALRFFNTLSREKEDFSPIDPKLVRIYTCGPTVYNYAHIGNLRSYVFADVLRKTLKYFDYNVKQVMNITDIGHLSSDADSGEDKMTKALLREGKELTLANMRTIADFYAEKFKEDLIKLNINMPDVMPFASDHIKEDIELIRKIEANGYAYKISDGIYFDTNKFKNYAALSGGRKNIDEEQSRIGENSEKKNPADFALWKFSDKIGYEAPWGKGFPGWHIECSAMSMKYLGEQFDIHTGGIDHISIHHTNEIAQSESATGKTPFVKYWLHHEFIDIGGEKMAKSEDNFLKLGSLVEKGFNPISYRFWLLMANYHTKMNFHLDALEGAEIALKRLFGLYMGLGEPLGTTNEIYKAKFKEYLEDDLDTPRALTLLWDLMKDGDVSNSDKKATILDFDKVLGLGFENLKKEIIPEEITKLAEERESARKNKDFKKSDELRAQINLLGYEVKDSSGSYKINKI